MSDDPQNSQSQQTNSDSNSGNPPPNPPRGVPEQDNMPQLFTSQEYLRGRPPTPLIKEMEDKPAEQKTDGSKSK